MAGHGHVGWRARIALCLAFSAGLSGTALSSGSSATEQSHKALIPVTYGISSETLNVLPQYLALHLGFFKKYGLNVNLEDITAGGPATIAAVVSGSAPFAVTSVWQIWNYIEQGAPLLAVAQEVGGYYTELCLRPSVVAATGINNKMTTAQMLQALHGQVVGSLTPGSVSSLLVNGLEKTYSVPASTFTQQSNASAAIDALMSAGSVAGAFTAPPYCEIAEAGGYGQAVWQLTDHEKPFAITAYGLTFTTTGYAKSHPKVVAAMVGALNATQAWMVKHPKQVAAFAVSQFAEPQSSAAAAIKEEGFPATTKIPAIGMRNAQDIANDYQTTTHPVSPQIVAVSYSNRYYNYGS